MNKEKLMKYTKYLTLMSDKLSAPVPKKHTGHPNEYKAFLHKEIDTVKKKLEALKLEGVEK